MPGPLPHLEHSFQAINRLKADGVVEDYAVAGAMALLFWTEPAATFDLDVLVVVAEPSSGLISLDAIYRWAEAHGYPEQAEHVLVKGIPTQFVPAPDLLSREAISEAVEQDYEGVSMPTCPCQRRFGSCWSCSGWFFP